MRGADSRIIEAIVGALLAAALLLAAFAVIAQEPASTGLLMVGLPDWADAPAARAIPSERARALSDGGGSGGGGCVVARDGPPAFILPLLELGTAGRLVPRGRATHGPRCTACA